MSSVCLWLWGVPAGQQRGHEEQHDRLHHRRQQQRPVARRQSENTSRTLQQSGKIGRAKDGGKVSGRLWS